MKAQIPGEDAAQRWPPLARTERNLSDLKAWRRDIDEVVAQASLSFAAKDTMVRQSGTYDRGGGMVWSEKCYFLVVFSVQVVQRHERWCFPF